MWFSVISGRFTRNNIIYIHVLLKPYTTHLVRMVGVHMCPDLLHLDLTKSFTEAGLA